jgi:hypothetical protein
MQRVDVTVCEPWSTKNIVSCPLFGGKYVPISYVAAMLDLKTSDVAKKFGTRTVNRIEGGGTFRNFATLNTIRDILLLNGWKEDKCDAALAIFLEKAAPPPRKRPQTPPLAVEPQHVPPVAEKRDSNNEDEEDEDGVRYLKRGKTKRRPPIDETPQWAHSFMDTVKESIGVQAVWSFKETPRYEEMCREAVKARVDFLERRLEAEMRPIVTKRLEEELKGPVMQKLELQRRQALMEPFKLHQLRPAGRDDNLVSYGLAAKQMPPPPISPLAGRE